MRKLLAGLAVMGLFAASPAFGAGDEAKAPAAKADVKQAVKPGAADLKTLDDKLSYIVGLNVGKNMKQMKLAVNVDIFTTALKDGISGKEPLLSEEEQQAVTMEYQKKIMAEQEATAAKNLKDGEAFLEANKKKEGVKVTASGLQYKVLSEGSGPLPKPEDTVTVNYRGTLIDGTEFDSSYKRGEPATFPLNRVIRGWTEGLQLMKVGSKYQFTIPSGLGYGTRGMGADIPGNSVLIFDVELVGTKEAPKTSAAPEATPDITVTPSGK